MRFMLRIFPAVLCLSLYASAQTADELVQKNIQAKGGLDKIRAIKSVRMTGRVEVQGFKATVGQENKRPDYVKETFTIQGMTAVQAYDGNIGWQIRPFGGRKDPEMMGEDDVRELIEDADFDGPLVDYRAKGNTVEYLGHDTVDGDDAYKLKVTLKNGDIIYYYLDPDAYLEIKKETQRFIRGSVRESVTEIGSYKPVNGVMYAFSIATGPKSNPDAWQKVSVDKIEVNVPIDDSNFKMPGESQPKPLSPGK